MQTLSQSAAKLIRKLHLNKHRKKENKFLVCGVKCVQEAIQENINIDFLVGTDAYLTSYSDRFDCYSTDAGTLTQISPLSTQNDIIAVVDIPKQDVFNATNNALVLFNIKDPGNLGTMIRLADWFGISQILCTKETVDYTNSKVVQAAMGSLFRINLNYTEILEEELKKFDGDVWLADMNGENVFERPEFHSPFALCIGSESHGFPDELKDRFRTISIPRFGKTESLNASVACGILMAEMVVKSV